MSDVRTFRAASMQEALQLVRAEMGGEAVILHTRQLEHRRVLPWLRPRQEVEITAGMGINVRPALPRSRPQAAVATPPKPAHVQHSAPPVVPQPRHLPEPRHTMEQRPLPAPTPAMPPAKSIERTTHRAGAASAPAWLDLMTPDDQPVTIPQPRDLANELRTFRETPAPAPVRSAPAPIEPQYQPQRDYRPEVTHNDTTTALARQLETIQKMLEGLGHSTGRRGGDDVPAELFALYTELIDADVQEHLARDLVFRLRQNCTPAQLGDPVASRALLSAMVESEIRCCDPISVARGRRKVVALVGATGVGKTTTIAKLAANFRLRDGIRMGLLTVDTYRIAAVEQLRTYADIIDLPMKVVTSPLDMRRALDELAGLDLVLIDTAGRSPRDELQIQELKRLLVEARVDEVHLVLSMTASLRGMEAAVEKFSGANLTSLILTKLDEAAGMGTLLSVSRKTGLPISYLTTGQDVPDDIEPARPARLARLILGQDRLQ